MKTSKAAVVLAFAGLIVSSNALALPGFSDEAPEGSIKQCVAEIAAQANYEGAGRVRHVVNSKERPVSGHRIQIDTTVYDADGSKVIREYATFCAVTDKAETRHFHIKEKGV